jgi:CRP-like cAMP-binding protein
LQSITAEEWFALFTAKMDLLHEVGKTIATNLATAPACKPTSKTATAATEQAAIESGVRVHMDVIQALPLFAGLDSETLQDILKYARIASYSRGAMVFMQGEQASRFYMVLEGCVKLYKGNADGQESVLHVMKAGDALLETVIFNNTPIPVNAQAVDNVKLLSIPASLIREKLQNNRELAINMLATVAGRSQAMISQFEQLTLKTVTQRVGWFLLKLFLENGERATNLKLPYDKSLIAAYLGMKPETFSRTLQTLKEQGIDIERNTVSLSDVFTLCNYCDMDLAAKCSRHGTAECPNPDCDAA